MSMEVLDVEKVRKEIAQRGWKLAWVIKQCELTRSLGYALLVDGMLPKDSARKAKALGKLSQLLGVEVRQILLTLEPKRVKKPA